MTFTIRPAERRHIPQISAIAYKIFEDAVHTRLMVPGAKEYPEEYRRWVEQRYRMRFVDPDVKILVVENSAGELVGCGIWTPKGTSSIKDALPRQSVAAWLEQQLLKLQAFYMRRFVLHCVDWAVLEQFTESTAQLFQGSPNRLHLDVLLVRPDYQGQGIGKQLLQWGLDAATEAGIPVSLESTVAGKPLYDKQGFKVVGYVQLNGQDTEIPAMMWGT